MTSLRRQHVEPYRRDKHWRLGRGAGGRGARISRPAKRTYTPSRRWDPVRGAGHGRPLGARTGHFGKRNRHICDAEQILETVAFWTPRLGGPTGGCRGGRTGHFCKRNPLRLRRRADPRKIHILDHHAQSGLQLGQDTPNVAWEWCSGNTKSTKWPTVRSGPSKCGLGMVSWEHEGHKVAYSWLRALRMWPGNGVLPARKAQSVLQLVPGTPNVSWEWCSGNTKSRKWRTVGSGHSK